jgi:hypothetical protein
MLIEPRFDGLPMASGLPPEADAVRAGRHVSKVPNSDMAHTSLDHLVGARE